VEFDQGQYGYADCHPWTELGDDPLDLQLKKLVQAHQTTHLTASSLQMAAIDAQARSQARNLVLGSLVPENHVLLGNCISLTHQRIEEALARGFRLMKLKVGLNWEAECDALLALASVFKQNALKLRLDFNSGCSLDPGQIHSDQNPPIAQVLERLSGVFDQIDWLEDPTPYDPQGWQWIQNNWGLQIALDQPKGLNWNLVRPESFSFLVLKPAIQSLREMIQCVQRFDKPFAVTSYLDHPLGQLSAAWASVYLSQVLSQPLLACGLLSHSVYEQTLDSRELQIQGSKLLGVSGTGFGLDELLKVKKWS
jgi:O-succinylbenzoate synthase